jgi:ferredoxin
MIKFLMEAIKRKYAVTGERWDRYAPVFHGAIRVLQQSEKPIIGPVLRKVARLDQPEKNFTQSQVINISKDLNKNNENQNTILPIQLIEKIIQKSPNIYIVDKCLCRDGKKCTNYPHDIGCIFLGKGARMVEDRRLGHKATTEEALAHVQKAVELGLIGQALWIEVEQFFWGIAADEMPQWFEICFCCPCCCLSLDTYKKNTMIWQERVHGVGWKASVLEKCTACGACVDGCPINAITLNGGDSITIAETCLGCGICVQRCPHEAVEIVQVEPPKNEIEDYFWGFRPEV